MLPIWWPLLSRVEIILHLSPCRCKPAIENLSSTNLILLKDDLSDISRKKDWGYVHIVPRIGVEPVSEALVPYVDQMW